MPIPGARRVATFNRVIGNRILGPITWWLPGFGRIEHRGRISGRSHRAPMMGFPSADRRRVVFALTYGPEANWVRNALVAGEFVWMTRRGGPIRLVEPRLVHDPSRAAVPRPIRLALGLLRVDDFLVAAVAQDGPEPGVRPRRASADRRPSRGPRGRGPGAA